MGDIWVALRQFYKSPGFAIYGCAHDGAGDWGDTAIFTLVHATLMKSLPVADPKTLYRVGDLDDCCVNGGFITTRGLRPLLVRTVQTLSGDDAGV